MDRPGQKLFSGSAGTLNEYSTLAVGNIRKDGKDLLEGLTLPDDVLESPLTPDFLPELFQGGEVPKSLNRTEESPRLRPSIRRY